MFGLINDAVATAVVGLTMAFLPLVSQFSLAYQHGQTGWLGVILNVVSQFDGQKSTKGLNLFKNSPYTDPFATNKEIFLSQM